ncbi:MAG: nuclear transport factor 2 family protein [Deltaproteobacteria bacterium]|nr:nuclear transport factor 2 family protein [Deltaproteobacteria bacterium]
MSRHVRVGGFALILMLAALPTFAQQQAEEEALRKLEHEWWEAYKQRDTQTLDRIMAEDFIFTDEEGQVYDKSHFIALARQQVVTAYTLGDLRIRVYGDAAVVTCPSSWRYNIEGKEVSWEFRSTDVFVKRQGQWQAVAAQDTRLPKKP